jgi:transposase
VIEHIEQGYSLREIATRFGRSVTTVHRRVHACGDWGRSWSAPAAGGTKKT